MAASRSSRRTYRQIGVFLPLERDVPMNLRVVAEADLPLDHEMSAGFLYVKGVSMGSMIKFRDGERVQLGASLFVVQSASTGELFFNKILERPWDPVTQLSQPPLELRASTYPHRIGDATIDIAGDVGDGAERNGVLPNVPYFNKLRFWQELDHMQAGQNFTVYSLFFEFCNGGTVDGLIDKYYARRIAIPEHFIWLVAEQLFLAIVSMRFGRYPVQDDYDDESRDGSESDQGSVVQPDNWARIYHRDLAANNVFINYIPKGPGRVPNVGLVNNAFPEIVVGDFGNSGIEGDDPATIPHCIYQPDKYEDQDVEPMMFDWEDIFAVGEILRKMSMTHTDIWNDFMKPNNVRVQTVNQEPTAPPYSDELIALLQRFEFRDMETIGVRDLYDELDTAFPSPETVRDNLLPQARARVVGYLNPAGRPAGYFDRIDVSWTRPEELMPFSYIMRYATDAGEGPDGRPPPDDGSESGSDDGSGGGEDAGGEDEEMSDPPPSSEEEHDGNGQPDNGSEQPGDQQQPGGADGENSSSPLPSSPPSPPPPPAEQVAMRELGKMHKWNRAKPRYQLRSLEFGPATILPLKAPP